MSQTQSTQTNNAQKPQYKLIVQRHTEYKNVKAIGTGAGVKPNEDATISSVRLENDKGNKRSTRIKPPRYDTCNILISPTSYTSKMINGRFLTLFKSNGHCSKKNHFLKKQPLFEKNNKILK